MNNYHFSEIIYRQAEKYGNRTELLYRDDKTALWLKTSWKEFADNVRLTSQALIDYGIGVQENIGIYSQNMPQCLYTTFGAFGIRAVEVPMYATSSPEQIGYIVNDSHIRLMFVGEQQQYNNAYKVQKENSEILKLLVIYDNSVVKYPDDTTSIYFDEFIRLGDNAPAESNARIRRNEAQNEDTAVIVYTSGTTGESKGVIMAHSNMLEAMRIHDIRLEMIKDSDVSFCFLPLSHIFEKTWICYCVHRGICIAVNRDPKVIQTTLREVHPTLMCNVPRFWEKVYNGVNEKINNSPKPIQRLLFNAIETGKKYVIDYRRKGLKAPALLSLKFHIYDKTVFALLKKVVGIDKGRAFPIAGAPLSDKMAEMLLSLNIPIIYGYGLSETTATVCCYPIKGYVIGSMGKIMPDIEVKIDEGSNEILVKGKTITPGYYNKPAETAKAFTEDGFFRTGDAGRREGDNLFFLERIKDLFKTSNGKYIAPQAIELSLASNSYIEQCAALGDNRKFVGALIVPNFDALEKLARQKEIQYTDRKDLVKNADIIKFYKSILEECQMGFASFEKIKRFTLLPAPFSMDTGELTDTLKLRRSVISKRYEAEIEEIYKEN
ncbi:MAG: long-chain fatty acid--CoA ligase [Tannerella sp.]|jgi:long-chain acyl-CoA synthetase|nr:long-chain fatty acid--CoA ligase [Tannerella sp.]